MIEEVNILHDIIGIKRLPKNTSNIRILKALTEIVRYFYNDFIKKESKTPTLFNSNTSVKNVLYYYNFLIKRRIDRQNLEKYSKDIAYSFDNDEEDDEDDNETSDKDFKLMTKLGQLSDSEIKDSLITWGKILISHSNELYRGIYHNSFPLVLGNVKFSPFTTEKEISDGPSLITISKSSGEVILKIYREIGILILEMLGSEIDTEIDQNEFRKWVDGYCASDSEDNIYKDSIICQYIKRNEIAEMLAKSRLTTVDDMNICPSYGLAQILLGLIYDDSYGIKPYLDTLKGINTVVDSKDRTWTEWTTQTALQIVSFTQYGEAVANFIIRLLKRLAKGKIGFRELDIQLSLLDTQIIEKLIGVNIRNLILEQIFFYLREFGLTVIDSQTYKKEEINKCDEYFNVVENKVQYYPKCQYWESDDWLKCQDKIEYTGGNGFIKKMRGGEIEDIVETCRDKRYSDTLICESARGNHLARKLILGKLTDNKGIWKPCPHKGLANIFMQLVYAKDSVLNLKENKVINGLKYLGIVNFIKIVLVKLAKGEFTFKSLNEYLNTTINNFLLNDKSILSKFLSKARFSYINRILKKFILDNYVFYYLRDFGLTSRDSNLDISQYDSGTCGLLPNNTIDNRCRSWEEVDWKLCPLNQVEIVDNLTNSEDSVDKLKKLYEYIINNIYQYPNLFSFRNKRDVTSSIKSNYLENKKLYKSNENAYSSSLNDKKKELEDDDDQEFYDAVMYN